jgi:hypothetical protein
VKAWAVVPAYLGVGLVWIYAVIDHRGDVGPIAVLVALLAFHLVLGAAVGRWWVTALPLVLLPLALPAGSVPGGGDLDQAWEIVLLMLPGLVALVAAGVGARKLRLRLRPRLR